jgi:hypothetical protein
MQQITFIDALATIEQAIPVKKALTLAVDQEAETSVFDSGFKAVHSIMKAFYKKDELGYNIPEMPEQEIALNLHDNPDAIENELAINSLVIESALNVIKGCDYVMSDKGVRFNLTSKSVKENIAKIKACIA